MTEARRRCAAADRGTVPAPAQADPADGSIAATTASTATPHMAEPAARRANGPIPEAIDSDRKMPPGEN